MTISASKLLLRGIRLTECPAPTGELSSAARLAERLEAAPLAALIANVARRAGIGAIPAPAFDGLTAQEREVLVRVVAGARSALLRKFGVSGRGDLSAAVESSELRPLRLDALSAATG
jgi:hypothetical protein